MTRMINFDFLSVISALIMLISVGIAAISTSLLINDPPSAQVLKVWRLNSKDTSKKTFLENIYKLLNQVDNQKTTQASKAYDNKMMRLGIEGTYNELKAKCEKRFITYGGLGLVLVLLGVISGQVLLALLGIVSMVAGLAMYMMPTISIDSQIKEKNKKMIPELLSILDSFKIFNQAGVLEFIVKDNIEVLSASKNDLLLLQATLVSEGEMVAFSEFGERVGTDLHKEFSSLVKSAIKGADVATMIVNIKALEDNIYTKIDRDLKETVAIRWKVVTTMVFVIFIPIVLIFGGPVLMQMRNI